MTEENIEAYHGVVRLLDKSRYKGVVSFEYHGVVVTGVPLPRGHEVVGLRERTMFVPYSNVAEVTFEEGE